jgi:hypothetical protein
MPETGKVLLFSFLFLFLDLSVYCRADFSHPGATLI